MSSEDDELYYCFYYPHPTHPTDASVCMNRNSKRTLHRLLADAVKETKLLARHFHQTEEYTLYKPVGLSLSPIGTLFERNRQWLREHHHIEDDQLAPSGTVTGAFPNGPDPDVVNILIVTSEILDSLDDVGDLAAHHSHRKLIQQRESEVRRIRRSVPTPSAGVESSWGIQDVVDDNADHFHAGRPDGNYGPPVALFHPTLGLLAHRLRHLDSDIPDNEPGAAQCQGVHMLITQALRSHKSRTIAIVDMLPQALGFQVTGMGGVMPYGVLGDRHPFGVVEVQKESGLCGDASLKAGLSYTRIVTDDKDEVVRRRRQSNYPAILIGIMGDLLEFGIAVYTDGPYCDCVFSERLRLDFYQNENVLRVARAFKAVQLALISLREFYAELEIAPPPNNLIAHLFPSPLPVPSCNTDMPSLTFTGRLSCTGRPYIMANRQDERRSAIYLATMPKASPDGPSSDGALNNQAEVVVKFTAGYHAEAHRILAAVGYAPALHACIPVCGGLRMVVMDRVYGEMAWAFEQREEILSYSIYQDVKNAVDLLHQHNLVFGDLRPPNIICTAAASGTGSEERLRAILIDFDWVGTHGSAFYPAVLNDMALVWAQGVQRHGLMDKEHDLAMLERFKKLCQVDPS